MKLNMIAMNGVSYNRTCNYNVTTILGISLIEESVEDTADGVVSEGLKYEYSPPTHTQLVTTDNKPVSVSHLPLTSV